MWGGREKKECKRKRERRAEDKRNTYSWAYFMSGRSLCGGDRLLINMTFITQICADYQTFTLASSTSPAITTPEREPIHKLRLFLILNTKSRWNHIKVGEGRKGFKY